MGLFQAFTGGPDSAGGAGTTVLVDDAPAVVDCWKTAEPGGRTAALTERASTKGNSQVCHISGANEDYRVAAAQHNVGRMDMRKGKFHTHTQMCTT